MPGGTPKGGMPGGGIPIPGGIGGMPIGGKPGGTMPGLWMDLSVHVAIVRGREGLTASAFQASVGRGAHLGNLEAEGKEAAHLEVTSVVRPG